MGMSSNAAPGGELKGLPPPPSASSKLTASFGRLWARLGFISRVANLDVPSCRAEDSIGEASCPVSPLTSPADRPRPWSLVQTLQPPQHTWLLELHPTQTSRGWEPGLAAWPPRACFLIWKEDYTPPRGLPGFGPHPHHRCCPPHLPHLGRTQRRAGILPHTPLPPAATLQGPGPGPELRRALARGTGTRGGLARAGCPPCQRLHSHLEPLWTSAAQNSALARSGGVSWVPPLTGGAGAATLLPLFCGSFCGGAPVNAETPCTCLQPSGVFVMAKRGPMVRIQEVSPGCIGRVCPGAA